MKNGVEVYRKIGEDAKQRAFERKLDKLMELQDMALGYNDKDEAERGDAGCKEVFESYKTNADLLAEAKYLLGTYFDWSHVNCDLKQENYKIWRSDVAKLKRFIAMLEKESV